MARTTQALTKERIEQLIENGKAGPRGSGYICDYNDEMDELKRLAIAYLETQEWLESCEKAAAKQHNLSANEHRSYLAGRTDTLRDVLAKLHGGR